MKSRKMVDDIMDTEIFIYRDDEGDPVEVGELISMQLQDIQDTPEGAVFFGVGLAEVTEVHENFILCKPYNRGLTEDPDGILEGSTSTPIGDRIKMD